jgi:hypothetical protein
MGGKWLELLKEISPRVTRAAVLRDPTVAAGPAEYAAIQVEAPSLGVDLIHRLSPLSPASSFWSCRFFLNLVVAIYLIIVGLMGLNAIYHWVQ